MDILGQAKLFVEKLSKMQKIIIGSVAALLVLGIILLIVLNSTKKEYAVLFNNLAPTDAASILEYLKENNLNYKIADDGTSILMEKEKINDTRLMLASRGLPADSYVGYELFDRTNLGMSEFVQKVNYRRALEGELQRTIKSMNEVVDVKVHLVIPEKTLLKKDEKQPTAAIKLHLKNGRSLSKLSIEGIQNLVASSIEGLTPDKVTITDNKGRLLSEPPLDDKSIAGLTSTQYEQQKRIEDYYASKVQALLDPALGPENSRVRLNTEIDFDQLQVNKTDYDPERQVERSEQNISDIKTDVDTSFVPGVNSQQETLNELKNYEISKADSHFIKGVGGIKRLTVTAIVNEIVTRETIKTGPKKTDVKDTIISRPRSEKELEGLREAIKNVVGYNEERGDEVNVLCVPFVEQISDKVLEVNEYNKFISVKWYEKEENQKLLLLILTILITAFAMYRLIHHKLVKDKMRIAMGLPEKLEKPVLDQLDASLIKLPAEEELEDMYEDVEEEVVEEDEEEMSELLEYASAEKAEENLLDELIQEADDILEELPLEPEDLLELKAELPEQLLLGDEFGGVELFQEEENSYYDIPDDEQSMLLKRAKAALNVASDDEDDVSESDLIKMELKDKVYNFITQEPEMALKIFKVFLSQDKIEETKNS
ncbi:MAG: flagellar M-ring protein FliF [Ignavibacteria bacterium]|jgi:flagellar M-ring protein FliF|nr:flagellar M-ring protein FliF [Ignavibacteria bacterium]